eukprot:11166827-Lingulodinium_polyedra.AAC.1
MLRVRDAMCVAVASPNGPILFNAKEDNSKELRSSILDIVTWDMTEAPTVVFQSLTLLSGRIKGCHCHAEELNMGNQIQCPWEGCRGPVFAG